MQMALIMNFVGGIKYFRGDQIFQEKVDPGSKYIVTGGSMQKWLCKSVSFASLPAFIFHCEKVVCKESLVWSHLQLLVSSDSQRKCLTLRILNFGGRSISGMARRSIPMVGE